MRCLPALLPIVLASVASSDATSGPCQSSSDDGCLAEEDASLLQISRQSPQSQQRLLPVAGSMEELVTGKGGWLDAHQHAGAGANWMGQIMCLPEAQQRMQQLFDSDVWKKGLEKASTMPGFVVHAPINEGMGVDDLYLYSLFARDQIGEVKLDSITTPGFRKAVESCRVDLEIAGADFLVGDGLIAAITNDGNNERVVTKGSGTTYPLLLCLEGVQNDSLVDRDIYRRRLLRTLLSSSPLHDFDSGYITRKVLYKKNATLRWRYEVQEAIDAKIVDSNIFTTWEYPGNTDTMDAAYNSKTGKNSVKFRWYYAVLGCNFAQAGNATRIQYWSRENERAEVMNSTNFGCWNNLENLFKSFSWPDIIGMDSLAPEQVVFSEETGGPVLEELAKTMLAAAKKKNRRMVMHMHVGEGSPMYDFDQIFRNGKREPMAALTTDEVNTTLPKMKERLYNMRPDLFQEMCAVAKQERLLDPPFLPIHKITELGAASCPPAYSSGEVGDAWDSRCSPGEPAHYEIARMNIDTILNIIEKRIHGQPGLEDFNEYIKFRFGHAVMTTPLQAQRMKALNVSVDLNMGSNIMTGSLRTNVFDAALSPFGSKSGVYNGEQWVHPQKSDAEVTFMFRHHAVLPLLLDGVDFLLGTDGQGVEHSNLAGQFSAINAMLRYYKQVGPIPLSASRREKESMHDYIAHRYVRKLWLNYKRVPQDPYTLALKNQRAFADWLDTRPNCTYTK